MRKRNSKVVLQSHEIKDRDPGAAKRRELNAVAVQEQYDKTPPAQAYVPPKKEV